MAPPIDELNEIGERVQLAVEDWPGAALRWTRVDAEEGCVSVGVEVTDFADLAAALVGRFGDAVDVRRVEYQERAHPFEVWWLDEETLELTVECVGGWDDRGWRLELVESSERVEATVTVGSYVMTADSTRPSRRAGRRVGHSTLGFGGEASSRLAAPLGDREVIDTFGGVTRTRYAPPRDPTPEEIERELDQQVPEPEHPTTPLSPAELQASWERARDLAEQARPYLIKHRAALAGSRFERYSWGVWFTVTFSRDVRAHRAALHPEIAVRHADHSQLDFEQIQRDVVAYLESVPGGGWSTCRRSNFGDFYDVIVVEGYADDPESARAQLKAQFGDTVQLLLQDGATHRPGAQPFVGYLADDETWAITVKRDDVTGPAFLLLDEDDPNRVTVTLLCSEPLPADIAGRTLESTSWGKADIGFEEPSEWVIALLRDGPLGHRQVIDAADGQPRPRISPRKT